MKKTVEEHAARFSEMAAEYDEQQDSEEYAACSSLVVQHADPAPDEVVLDLGTGTGAIALALAGAERVVGRDVSEGMLAEARSKAESAGIDNVAFGEGSFREPNYDGPVDVVTSNFAMHHLSDEEKAEAIETVARLGPRKFVLGDLMLFEEADPAEEFYDPEVDDPATVGVLAALLTDAGFALTAVEPVGQQVGVVVAERLDGTDGDGGTAETGVGDERGSEAGE